MAAIAMVFGSIFGFFGAVTGWVVFDISFLSAVGIYLGAGVGLGLLAVTAKAFAGNGDCEMNGLAVN